MKQATLIPIIADYIMVKTLFHKYSQLLGGILLKGFRDECIQELFPRAAYFKL